MSVVYSDIAYMSKTPECGINQKLSKKIKQYFQMSKFCQAEFIGKYDTRDEVSIMCRYITSRLQTEGQSSLYRTAVYFHGTFMIWLWLLQVYMDIKFMKIFTSHHIIGQLLANFPRNARPIEKLISSSVVFGGENG